MKTAKRPWTRAEKSLFVIPLLLALAAGGNWLLQRTAPLFIGTGELKSVAFSPDGRYLAVLTRHESRLADAGAIYDARTGALQARLPVPTPNASLHGLDWAPDSSRFATTYVDLARRPPTYKYRGKKRFKFFYRVAIWDAASGARSGFFPYAPAHEYSYASLDWARDGKLWGVGTPPALFDVQSGQRLRRFGPQAVPGALEWSMFNASHTQIVMFNKEGDVWIYEIPGGRMVRKWRFRDLSFAAWSRDDDVLAIFQNQRKKKDELWSGSLRLVNVRTGRVLTPPPLVHGEGESWGRDGQIAFVDRPVRPNARGGTGSETSRVLVWNFRAAKMVWQKTSGEQDEQFSSLSFSPNGRWLSALISTSSSWRVVWDAKTGKEICRRRVNSEEQEMKWAPDSKSLATYGYGGNGIRIWRLSD